MANTLQSTVYSMDLHEDNPNASETSLPLLDHSILDVLEFTPVCVVCTICNRPINGTVRAVRHHMSLGLGLGLGNWQFGNW